MVAGSSHRDRGGGAASWLHGAVPRWQLLVAVALLFAAEHLLRLATTVAGPAAAAAKHGGLPAPPEAVFGEFSSDAPASGDARARTRLANKSSRMAGRRRFL